MNTENHSDQEEQVRPYTLTPPHNPETSQTLPLTHQVLIGYQVSSKLSQEMVVQAN